LHSEKIITRSFVLRTKNLPEGNREGIAKKDGFFKTDGGKNFYREEGRVRSGGVDKLL
jgi:hypothetical protein